MKTLFVITATIDRKRQFFIVEADEEWQAIRIFNQEFPGIRFRNIKPAEKITPKKTEKP